MKLKLSGPRTEEFYRGFVIFGIPGYYRYESVPGHSVSSKHWKTIKAVKNHIDKKEKFRFFE